MFCSSCGKQIKESMSYCPFCGESTTILVDNQENKLYYYLPLSSNREYDIKVYAEQVIFSGKFWYLKDKEFYRNQNTQDTAMIHNFIGMGYLSKRSYRKTIAFVLGGTVLEVVKMIADKLSDLVNKANGYLQWIGHEISLPDWINYTVNTIAVICLIMAVVLFFSKKKVVEISFVDKRICIPQKSISNTEYAGLFQTIKNLSQKK